LLKEGHPVVTIDNEATGRQENVPGTALYFQDDVANIDDLERRLKMIWTLSAILWWN